ncbi:hypothetical protein EYF80_047267 [Liparis tanakae]|uniref:Uncharacterized protein n=1 Tax=Liparis tanakae TaxID=230148 RepID=A0A4Z2FQC7_9TELE|nr:hypothetical protein EYF80_047267 [Liparis tanakae]
MRGLCKEEDYAFLGTPERTTAGTPGGALEDDWGDGKEDRVREGEEDRVTETVPGLCDSPSAYVQPGPSL